jgi:multidrug efflux system outer membrane protein
MRRFALGLAAALALNGCAMGPAYQPAPVVPAATQVGVQPSDSTHAFFDSLAAARAADSARGMRVLPHDLRTQALSDLAWVEVLHDSTLLSLVATAVQQNRDLAVATARISEFRAQAGVARAPLFPSLSVNGSASKNQIALGSFPPTAFNALRVTGDVAWELDFWGKNRRGLEAANADAAAQEAAERAAVLSLVSDVARGYLQLLELDQEDAIAARTVASRRATLDLARQRFSRGLVSELDVRQFEAQMAAPAVRLAQVQRSRAEQERALRVLLGEGPGPIPRGASLATAALAVTVPDSLPATLLARRPDVIQAERSYAAANARIGAASAARLPSINIVGSYGSQVASTSQLFTSSGEVYQLQGGISIPLFTGGRLSGAIDAARARADQARARYEQVVLTSLREAGDAVAGVRAARDVAAASATQAVALRRALELAELRYQTGVSGYLEVLDAQRGLFEAELALSQAQLGQLVAAVQLYKALGGSWTAAPH